MTSHGRIRSQPPQEGRVDLKTKFDFLMRICRDPEMSQTAISVAAQLVEFFNDSETARHPGRAWPSLLTIAAHTGRHLSTVITAVKRLEEAGYFRVERRPASGSHDDVNLYAPIWGNRPRFNATPGQHDDDRPPTTRENPSGYHSRNDERNRFDHSRKHERSHSRNHESSSSEITRGTTRENPSVYYPTSHPKSHPTDTILRKNLNSLSENEGNEGESSGGDPRRNNDDSVIRDGIVRRHREHLAELIQARRPSVDDARVVFLALWPRQTDDAEKVRRTWLKHVKDAEVSSVLIGAAVWSLYAEADPEGWVPLSGWWLARPDRDRIRPADCDENAFDILKTDFLESTPGSAWQNAKQRVEEDFRRGSKFDKLTRDFRWPDRDWKAARNAYNTLIAAGADPGRILERAKALDEHPLPLLGKWLKDVKTDPRLRLRWGSAPATQDSAPFAAEADRPATMSLREQYSRRRAPEPEPQPEPEPEMVMPYGEEDEVIIAPRPLQPRTNVNAVYRKGISPFRE